VGEGVGLLGVGDVAAGGELDEAGVRKRSGQLMGDRAEGGVAGVAGDDQAEIPSVAATCLLSRPRAIRRNTSTRGR
jgi:hypothetical protein